MGKDPAILFYTSDFISGTLTMSDEQRGKYIMLLCLQHQQGRLSEEDMLNICKTYDKKVYAKFEKDSEGLFFNSRMEEEINKRKNYSESRRKNRLSKKDMSNTSKTYVKHMEDENENRNKVKKEDKNKYAEFVFLTEIEYKKLCDEHTEYWVKVMITELDNYKGANGKKYKSDYRAILSWVAEKVKTSQRYIDWKAKQRRDEALKRSRGDNKPLPGAEQIGTKIGKATITNETPPKVV